VASDFGKGAQSLQRKDRIHDLVYLNL
jgi:hypothetical protein